MSAESDDEAAPVVSKAQGKKAKQETAKSGRLSRKHTAS